MVPQLSEPGPVITTEPPTPQQQKPHFSPQGSGPGLTTAETAPGSLDGLGTAPRLARSLAFRRGPRRSRRSEAGLGGRGGHRAGRASGRSGLRSWVLGEATRGPGNNSRGAPRRPQSRKPPRPSAGRAAWAAEAKEPSSMQTTGPALPRERSAPRSPTCTAVSEVSSPASPLQRPTRCSVFWGHRGQQKQLSSDSCWEFLGMQKLPSQSLTEESSRTRPPPLIPICSE